jgi:hypothetical protein
MKATYCSHCGAELEDEDLFCAECGAAQKRTNQAQSETPSEEPLIQVPPLQITDTTPKKPGCLNQTLAGIAALVAGYIVGAISAFVGETFLVGELDNDTLDMLRVMAFILALFAMWSVYRMVRISGSMPKPAERPSFPIVRSGTKRFPTPRHVILEVLRLYEANGGEFATFSISDDAFIQLVIDDGIVFNFAWPYKSSPESALTQKGAALPAGFQLTGLEAGSYAMFEGPLLSKSELAATIDMLFQNLYDTGKSYQLEGVLE